MIVQIVDQPINLINCQVAVLYLYSDMRPPKGATGTVDWYMNGFISKLIWEGKITGRPQELVMIATQGRIITPRVILLGMGPKKNFKLKNIYPIWKKASLSICHTKLCQLVTTIPFAREWSWEVGQGVEEMMRGLLAGIRQAKQNIRDFRLYLTDFDELGTKANKDSARQALRSFAELELLGF